MGTSSELAAVYLFIWSNLCIQRAFSLYLNLKLFYTFYKPVCIKDTASLSLIVTLDTVTQVPLDQDFTVLASGNGQGILEV